MQSLLVNHWQGLFDQRRLWKWRIWFTFLALVDASVLCTSSVEVLLG